MKIAFFYYDGFAEFEIALAWLVLHKQDCFACALENREYRSEEHQRFLVDATLRDLDPASIDLFVIPGGNPGALYESAELKDFIGRLLAAGRKVAGICGGSELLAGLGFLEGKRCTGNTSGVREGDSTYAYYAKSIISEEHVVADGNVITGQGQAYAEFALELARQLGLFKDEAEYREDLRWVKNLR